MESPQISEGATNNSFGDMEQRQMYLPLGKRRNFREGTKGEKLLTPCEVFWENFVKENISVQCSSTDHTLKCQTSTLHKHHFLDDFNGNNERQPETLNIK